MKEPEVSNFHPRVEDVAQILARHFGHPDLGNKKNPFNELLYIILSSRTPPDRYREAYLTLRRVYPRADSLAKADPEDIAQIIGWAGLQNRKARAIVGIADHLRRKFGRVTLAPLEGMSDLEAEQFLVSLPEVSKKTARCVLMYALNRQVFPVDAHCFRITKRLGWVQSTMSLTDRVADELQAGIPAPIRKDLHIGMVVLGRHYCLSRDPKCEGCPLREVCVVP